MVADRGAQYGLAGCGRTQGDRIIATVVPLRQHPRSFIRSTEGAAAQRSLAGHAESFVRESGLSGGLGPEELERLESLVFAHRVVRRGERLFNSGDTFNYLYSIRTGFFKTSLPDGHGREQVLGFFMPDELLGIDGVADGRYNVCAIALEDGEVRAMPYKLIEAMAREIPALQRSLNAALAREVLRSYGVMTMLSSMGATERLAGFLLNLSGRLAHRGSSGFSFRLRMTREEIGNHLGLSLETVSRAFSALHKAGVVDVRQRDLCIVDISGLERIIA